MTAYYNENDPYAAQWLRNLIRENHIAPGDVDERSIAEVRADDLRGYVQCHWFAGIAGWSLALRLATPTRTPTGTGGGQQKGEQLNNQVKHHGPIASGSPAQTEKRGQLSPAFSLWLMGFPSSWVAAAPSKASRASECSEPQATPSSRSSRPSSSKRQRSE